VVGNKVHASAPLGRGEGVKNLSNPALAPAFKPCLERVLSRGLTSFAGYDAGCIHSSHPFTHYCSQAPLPHTLPPIRIPQLTKDLISCCCRKPCCLLPVTLPGSPPGAAAAAAAAAACTRGLPVTPCWLLAVMSFAAYCTAHRVREGGSNRCTVLHHAPIASSHLPLVVQQINGGAAF